MMPVAVTGSTHTQGHRLPDLLHSAATSRVNIVDALRLARGPQQSYITHPAARVWSYPQPLFVPLISPERPARTSASRPYTPPPLHTLTHLSSISAVNSPALSDAESSSGAIPLMSFRSRRATMRPAREFSVVLRARDTQVNTLQDDNDTLKVQLEAFERRLTNARANAYADARAQQLQERKIEQLREKLHDSRGGFAALRRELEDARRGSETQRVRLAKADGENLRHRDRITELEAALQAKSSQVLTSDVEDHDVEFFEGVSHDDILDVLAQVAIDLEAVARMTEEFPSFDKPSESVPRAARANRVEMSIQTIPEGVLRPTSGQDQRRIRELEVELERSRRLNEELRNAVEEERRLVQDLKTSSAQEQSRMTSLADAAKRDQEAIKVLEGSVDEYRSGIDSAEAQVALLRILLEESRTFNDDLEESYNSIVACKDLFIQDLQERVEDLAATSAWSQKREAMLHDVQDRLAAADIEILELRLELEGAQRNAVASTNRIIQLEAKSSTARHRLRTKEADLRDELGVAFERVYALEDELVAAQGRLDNAESRNRQLRQELDRYVNTPTRLPNGPPTRDDTHDVNDTDSASDEGSVDTLVMDPDEHSQTRISSGTKDVDSPVSVKQDERLSHNATPLSVRALEARLEAMTLKYEAAEAARVCGEDVENMLRAKLQALSKDDLCPLSTTPALVEPDLDMSSDSPSEEWHSLPTIPEEEEPDISRTLERVAPPRIQTRSLIVAKNAVPPPTTVGNEQGESPLLPSPTLSDIWFCDMLALVETGSSVLDWELPLPSPGGDSDSL